MVKERISIGLTGGIGSGKSSVARYLGRLPGLACIDADQVCRELLEPSHPGWHALRSALGERYLQANGRVDRQLLRTAIFQDCELRQKVNGLIHPLARAEIHTRVTQDGGAGVFLIEVPLLFESGWDTDFDRTIVVYAAEEVRLARLMQRDRLTFKEALAAIAAQEPLAEKALRANHVIDNSGGWAYTCLQLLRLTAILRRLVA